MKVLPTLEVSKNLFFVSNNLLRPILVVFLFVNVCCNCKDKDKGQDQDNPLILLCRLFVGLIRVAMALTLAIWGGEVTADTEAACGHLQLWTYARVVFIFNASALVVTLVGAIFLWVNYLDNYGYPLTACQRALRG